MLLLVHVLSAVTLGLNRFILVSVLNKVRFGLR